MMNKSIRARKCGWVRQIMNALQYHAPTIQKKKQKGIVKRYL